MKKTILGTLVIILALGAGLAIGRYVIPQTPPKPQIKTYMCNNCICNEMNENCSCERCFEKQTDRRMAPCPCAERGDKPCPRMERRMEREAKRGGFIPAPEAELNPAPEPEITEPAPETEAVNLD